MKTLTQRIKEDNIHIVWGEDNDVSDILRSETNSYGGVYYVWRIVIASDVNGSTIEVEYSNSVNEGLNNPRITDVFNSIVSDASGVVASEDFVSWGSEVFDIGADSVAVNGFWPLVEKAQETYQACVKETDDLRAFLGNKFDAYMHETENDI